MSEAAEYDPYALPSEAIQEPPVSLWAALKKIGPGIILAGTIVGSGELLLTTKFPLVRATTVSPNPSLAVDPERVLISAPVTPLNK